MKSRLNIGLILAFFVLASLPYVSTFVIYQPDERHYTNAALIMREHGDWLTPHTAEGAPRFLKPILTYWGVAGGFALTGVNVLGSRLCSLLACAASVWLTFRIARRLTGDRDTALLAALVLASHLQLLSAATRANPDALLTLFTLMTLDGFLRLLESPERKVSACWLAYGGAALAVATKGLLGALVVVFGLAFVLVHERKISALKKYIHIPSILTALAVGGAWFVYIFVKHSSTALGSFYDDQVESKVGHWWTPFIGVPKYAGLLALNFLPWTLPVIEQLVRGRRQIAGRLSPLSAWFILAWAGLTLMVFGSGNYSTVRYLLPAAPMLAIWVADVLQASSNERLIFSVSRIRVAVLLLVLVAAFTGFWLRLEAGLSIKILVALTAFVVVTIWAFAGARRRLFGASQGLGLTLLLLYLAGFWAAQPVVLPERAEQVVAALRARDSADKPLLVVGDVKLASRVRLLLGKPDSVVFKQELGGEKDFSVALVGEADAERLRERGMSVALAATEAGGLGAGQLSVALRDRNLVAALRDNGRKYFLVTLF